jgi:ribonuclease D
LRKPKRAPYDEVFVARLDRLRAWRKKAAAEMEVESDVVLPRDIMESAARTQPKTIRELGDLMLQVPWRFNQFGEKILNAMQENIAS